MNKIMTHLVAGFPDRDQCLQLILGFQEASAAVIELQIPFSDPSADGPDIMKANDVALAGGMTIAQSFELIADARARGLSLPVYVMTYVNKVVYCGISEFCALAECSDVQGLIIPDLPFDSSEYAALAAECRRTCLQLVPVLSPGMSVKRLEQILSRNPGLVYITSSRDTTGNRLQLSKDLKDFIAQVRRLTDSEVALGFGIRTKEDVESALKLADIAVIGSEITRRITTSGSPSALTLLCIMTQGGGRKQNCFYSKRGV